MSRPRFPKGRARSKILQIRVTLSQRVRYQQAATEAGLSISEWMRYMLNIEATKKPDPVLVPVFTTPAAFVVSQQPTSGRWVLGHDGWEIA